MSGVTLTRWMIDVPPVPFMKAQMRSQYPGFEGNVDRWQIIHYQFPSTICIDVGVAKPAPVRRRATAAKASTAT